MLKKRKLGDPAFNFEKEVTPQIAKIIEGRVVLEDGTSYKYTGRKKFVSKFHPPKKKTGVQVPKPTVIHNGKIIHKGKKIYKLNNVKVKRRPNHTPFFTLGDR